jgi:hypothetical protein
MDRQTIEGFLGKAESAASAARAELTRAREQLSHAESKHDESRSSTSRRAVSDATIDLESAERVARKCEDDLEQARIGLVKFERAEKLQQYESAKGEIKRLLGIAHEGIVAVIAKDKELYATVVGAVVTPFSRALAIYENGAEALARDLGMTHDLDRQIPRPSLAELCLSSSRQVTKARAVDQRDPVTAWIEQADLSWQMADSTAEDLANREAYANRAQWTPGHEAIAAPAKEGGANGAA